MKTEYLKTLQVISRVGSFSRAATELFVTQSAISQRIKFLEDHYGCQLLDRSSPTLVLTEAGKIVVHRGEQILKIGAKLIDDLKHQGGKARLSICCTPTFGVAYLPQVIEQCMRHHADKMDLKFMFHSIGQAIRKLLDNEFDLAVIEHCEQLEVPGFHTVKLPDDDLIFISSPDLNLSEPEVDIRSLLSQCLIARKNGCSSRMLLERNLAQGGYKIDDFSRSIVMDDLRLTLESVVSGGAIAFISRSMAVKYLAAGLLREHRVPGFNHIRQRTAIINRERMDDPFIKEFISCVVATFEFQQTMCPHSC